jgi:hypothetical protein
MNLLSLAERFRCLPGAVLDEDTGLLRLLEIEKLVLAADPDYHTRMRGGGEPDGRE